MSQSPLFTVFTPTFNRAKLLHRVYDSLKKQTLQDFEWLIVDDGSTDNTREIVGAWMEESSFEIRYYYQANAHKKAAFNHGVREAHGELFLTWDSDDEAVPEALEILDRHWKAIPEDIRDSFSAVTGLCVDQHGKIVGDRFPMDVLDSDSIEILYRYKMKGEKWGFQRTAVLRQFPYPEDVQGFVPEGIVWSAIATRFKTRFVNEILRIYHTEQDSLSHGGQKANTIPRDAEGYALWTRDVLVNEGHWFFHNPKRFLKMAANYTRFHLHLQSVQPTKRWRIQGAVPKLLVISMYPVGFTRYILDLRQIDRERQATH